MLLIPGFTHFAAGLRPARGWPRVAVSVETLLVAASLFWALSANRAFLTAALQDRSASEPSAWGFGAALFVLLFAVHLLLMSLVANRWTVKPLLAGLIVATALATYFMQAYGVYLDPTMLRNTLRSDPAEARELLSWRLAWHLLLYAALPLLLLWRVRLLNRPWRRAALVRLGLLLGALVLAVGALLSVFQPLSSLMRNHKEMRYLITPSNYLWSLASVVAADARGATQPRQAIGLDARPGPSWATRTRPLVVVMVVGETARAANWGLNGYARQTTPQLAQLPVVNFNQATACGTNTETSVPCMFAPVGRRDYDEDRIRGSQSLLHVAARAGVAVQWIDNQSGCKGVCDGLPSETLSAATAPALCDGERCLDEALLLGIDQRLASASGTQLLVLHMLGNHGPSYFRRYPPAFARFQPACTEDDLRLCSPEQIVNAYDNALLYTDHVLATLLGKLQAQAGRVDSALIYMSDHGESLGEKGLFLHGLPYAIAPDVQTRVPLVVWGSAGLAGANGLDWGCMRGRAAAPVAHDHLFHTVLSLLDVRTSLYDPAWDLLKGCQAAAGAGPAR